MSDDDPDCPNSTAEKNYVPDKNDFEPHRFFQAEQNGSFRNLSLSKDKADLLASGLNENNLLNLGVLLT